MNIFICHIFLACRKYENLPVRLCNPAPRVDRNEPIRITHSFGHASLATTNPPCILSPNLRIEMNQSESPSHSAMPAWPPPTHHGRKVAHTLNNGLGKWLKANRNRQDVVAILHVVYEYFHVTVFLIIRGVQPVALSHECATDASKRATSDFQVWPLFLAVWREHNGSFIPHGSFAKFPFKIDQIPLMRLFWSWPLN